MTSGFPPNRLATLVTGAAAVAGESDLAQLLRRTIETGMDLTGARYGALGVLGEDGRLVEFLHAGLDDEAAGRIGPLPQGRGVLGIITEQQRPVRLDHVEEHPQAVGFPSAHPVMESFLGVPILINDRVYGNLYLTGKEGGFSEEDQSLVEALASIAGSAIRNARLQRRLRRLAVIEDRERIARDLHDAIIQDLFAVGLALQVESQKVADPGVQESIRETVRRLDDAIASLRRFIFDLRPPVWAPRSLREEARDLVDNLSAPYATPVHLAFVGSIEEVPPGLIEDALQVVKEATSNALRHADADDIAVELRAESHALSIVVADTGSGFDPADNQSGGMGLENLRARARRAGGSAEIESNPSTGTRVRVTLPI